MSEGDQTVRESPGQRLYGETLEPGAMIGRYEVEALVDGGGCANVYRARARPGPVVAIKLLHGLLARSANMVRRFRQEALAVQKIAHPNIVQVTDVGAMFDGRPYFVMEWIAGGNLRGLLEARGELPLDVIASIVHQVGDALTAAHAHGVIHRDIKAANILVEQAEPDMRVRLVDFGIAKLLEPIDGESISTNETVVGTPIAMAPEQIRREAVDHRTDVYGFGVLLYHLATGEVPFDGADAAEIEDKHLHAPPPLPSAKRELPPGFDDLVVQCMAKRREDRYGSIAEIVDALDLALGDARGGAVGVYVAAADLDGDVDAALDRAVAELERAGLRVAFEAGEGFLAVDVDTPDARRRAIDAAVACAAPELAVRVHVADARIGPRGPSGGALFELSRWPDEPPGGGVVVSGEAGEGVRLPPDIRSRLTILD